VIILDGNGRCQQARIVLLSVGDGPVQAVQARQMLEGQVLTYETLKEAADTAAEKDIDPGSDIHASADFRRHLAGVLSLRAFQKAFERARVN
jgi:carbon-monoxide dehydrogenase medium subunit